MTVTKYSSNESKNWDLICLQSWLQWRPNMDGFRDWKRKNTILKWNFVNLTCVKVSLKSKRSNHRCQIGHIAKYFLAFQWANVLSYHINFGFEISLLNFFIIIHDLSWMMSNEINNYVLESIPKIVSFIIYLFIIPSIYADILGKGSFNHRLSISFSYVITYKLMGVDTNKLPLLPPLSMEIIENVTPKRAL